MGIEHELRGDGYSGDDLPELYEHLPKNLRDRVEFRTEKVDGGMEIEMIGVEFFAPSFGRKEAG